MPPWLIGIGVVIIGMLRRPILAWLFGLVKREAGSLLSSYGEEQLQRDAAAARAAAEAREDGQRPGVGDGGPGSSA